LIKGGASGSVWITWERHRRTRELSRYLRIPLFEFESSHSRWVKHPWFCLRTLGILLRRPETVFIQCPSVLLGFLCAILKPLLRYRFVVDAHNEVFIPETFTHPAYVRTMRFIVAQANLVIVTNRGLYARSAAPEAEMVVLPDRIPDLPAAGATARARPRVTAVCSYKVDEPIAEMLKAAALLPEFDFVFTGPSGRLSSALMKEASPNITFSGFLDEPAYVDLLRTSSVILALTVTPDCLLCAAHEAVAVERPLVTSDTAALRRHLSSGVLFTSNVAAQIAGNIRSALEHQDALVDDLRRLKRTLSAEWETQAAGFEQRLRSVAVS